MWRRLREDVGDELARLARSLEDTAAPRHELLAVEGAPNSWDVRAAASTVTECYTGVENILKRIAKQVDRRLPAGEAWHRSLVRQLAAPTADRPAMVTPELLPGLLDCLGFRHMARGHYGYDLEWARLRPHLENLPQLIDAFTTATNRFLDEIERRGAGGTD